MFAYARTSARAQARLCARGVLTAMTKVRRGELVASHKSQANQRQVLEKPSHMIKEGIERAL